MKKVQLERILQALEPVPSPKASMEQYATPASIAAELVYIAFGKGDIAARRVLDAGCGNGILGIAAKLLGAAQVIGVDADADALRVAEGNARRAHADVAWVREDIADVREAFDTVLMNPPFGAQTKHADLPFLDRGLSIARVVYSFHNAVTEEFIRRRIEARGARVTDRMDYEFPLPRTFPFHRKEVKRVPVVLLRTETAKG